MFRLVSDIRVLKPLCYIYIGVISLVRSLDRTNFVQDILSRTTLEQYLILVRREWIHSNTLWTHHRELWAENGDALSRIYAGTGALNTSFTRSGKRTLAGTRHFSLVVLLRSFIPEGVLSDATKSVSRAYINNFQDKGKQVAIDMFLVEVFPCSRNKIAETSTLQGNLSNQLQVTIYDPIHDYVRATLDRRYIYPLSLRYHRRVA